MFHQGVFWPKSQRADWSFLELKRKCIHLQHVLQQVLKNTLYISLASGSPCCKLYKSNYIFNNAKQCHSVIAPWIMQYCFGVILFRYLYTYNFNLITHPHPPSVLSMLKMQMLFLKKTYPHLLFILQDTVVNMYHLQC